MLRERIVMFRMFAFIILGLSLALFSGCVSQKEFRAMETELNNTQKQVDEEKKSFANLQIQIEKLTTENKLLLESVEDLKLEVENEKPTVELIRNTHPESDSYTDKTHRPYSILLSSCQQQKSVEKVLSKYNKSDLDPYVVKVDLGEKGSWWRIFAGHYETRERAIIEMNKHGLTDKLVLNVSNVKHMDDSNSENEVSGKMSFLAK